MVWQTLFLPLLSEQDQTTPNPDSQIPHLIVTEAIYDLRESHNCPQTFDTYFTWPNFKGQSLLPYIGKHTVLSPGFRIQICAKTFPKDTFWGRWFVNLSVHTFIWAPWAATLCDMMPFLRREALGGNIACHNHGRAKCGEQIFSRPWGGYSWNLTWFPRLFIFFVWLVVIPSNIYCPDVRGSGNCPLLFLRVSLDHTPLYPYAHRNFFAVRTLQWRRSLEVEWVLKIGVVNHSYFGPRKIPFCLGTK